MSEFDFEPKFKDCTDCKNFRRFIPQRICGQCGSGEFFEEKLDDSMPSDDELMKIYSKMDKYD